MQRILKIELGGVEVKSHEFDLDIKPLMKIVLSRYFGNSVQSIVDVIKMFPKAIEAN